MNALALAASLIPLLVSAPAKTAHGDSLTYAGALPGGRCHAFRLLVRDSLVWDPLEMVMLRFPYSMTFAFEQRAYRVDGSMQHLGTVLDTLRKPVLGDPLSIPAAAFTSSVRDDGRRSVLVFATFRGMFSADSLVQVSIGRLQREGLLK